MEFPNEHIIEDLYRSGLVTDIETTQEYKELLEEYNNLYDTIEDKNLLDKLKKLEELKNEFHSTNDEMVFKCGFSMATKIIIDALTTNV